MLTNTYTLLGLTLCLSALAQMQMKTPHPLGHESSVFRNPAKAIDTRFNLPLKADKSDYPCKGYLNLVGTPEGQSQVTWDAGTDQFITLEANSTHSEQIGSHAGGSCQVSLSYDNGVSFKVIKSFIGSCPDRSQAVPTLDFTIPKEAPTGDALLSWSWFNRELEMYQNCAVIHIQKGGAGISALPDMFVANVGTECFTPRRDADVLFPDPGTDVVYGDWYYGVRYPSGPNCAPVKSMPKIGDTVTLVAPGAAACLATGTLTTLLTRTGAGPSATVCDDRLRHV